LKNKSCLDENVTSSVSNSTSQGQKSASGTTTDGSNQKWFSVSARRAGAGTDYPGDRDSTRSGTYSSRNNDARK